MTSPSEKILLWSEDFQPTTDAKPNTNYWTPDLGDGSQHGLTGWGNHERQFYTTDSLTVDHKLTISAKREKDVSPIETYYGPAEWTSGKIHTAGKVYFKYGYLEISAKMPSGVGTWPALWLLGKNISEGSPWPKCGEIDLFEGNGAKPRTIQSTLHLEGAAGEFGITGYLQVPELLSDSYNSYAIDWREDSIEWFFNGNSYLRFEKGVGEFVGKNWPFNDYFYLIVNQAIGGWFVGDVDPLLQSSTMEIAYIKHFSIAGVGEVITN
jgi:beta-glucanase (GH16 family)